MRNIYAGGQNYNIPRILQTQLRQIIYDERDENMTKNVLKRYELEK